MSRRSLSFSRLSFLPPVSPLYFRPLSSRPLSSSLAVCGKHPTFDPQRPADSHWPWLAAIYRSSTAGLSETKVAKAASQAGSLKRNGGAGTGKHDRASEWQLVCSGALVNQRSVVVAAHCVTELGKVYPLDAAKIKVVVGKHFRDDQRDTKSVQHLRVSSGKPSSRCSLGRPQRKANLRHIKNMLIY